jgi:riboflavin kinase/FMN adenylyltransferase
MIDSLEKKYDILNSSALHNIIEQKFNEEFAQLSPYEFVKFLKKKFPTLGGITVGEDFKFGHGQAGDAKILKGYAKHLFVDSTRIPS